MKTVRQAFVIGWEDIYKVGEDGTVWRVDGVEERPVVPYDNDQGYLKVDLKANGKRKQRYVHNLVAEAFCGETKKPGRNQVHHLNGDALDNCADNLMFVSKSEHQAIHEAQRRLDEQRKNRGRMREEVKEHEPAREPDGG